VARSFQLCGHIPFCLKELTMTDKPEGPVEQRIKSARDSLPGRRNGLPEGALGRPSAQGDENRDPPPNAPTIPD
jgi:hypothetical protein